MEAEKLYDKLTNIADEFANDGKSLIEMDNECIRILSEWKSDVCKRQRENCNKNFIKLTETKMHYGGGQIQQSILNAPEPE